jgi:hypothetical protein
MVSSWVFFQSSSFPVIFFWYSAFIHSFDMSEPSHLIPHNLVLYIRPEQTMQLPVLSINLFIVVLCYDVHFTSQHI